MSVEEDPIQKISILEIYQFVTGFDARTHKEYEKYQVRCPVKGHPDKHPSCYLNPKNDRYHCFACGAEGGKLKMIIDAGKSNDRAEAAEWIKRCVGASSTLTFKPQPKVKAKHIRGETELVNKAQVAIHPYTDDTGRTIYEVIRNQGKPAAEGSRSKTFSQRLIGPDGKWIWRFEGQSFKRWPYRLQGIKKAAKEKKSLIVIEGEIHCDALSVLNLYTSTIAQGWEHPWEKSWNKFLVGIPVIFVLADADKVGRSSAEKRAKNMSGAERKVAVVEIFPDRDNGDDILNWMVEENIIYNYKDEKINTIINWKKMYKVPLDEARKRVIAKITEGYKKSTIVYTETT